MEGWIFLSIGIGAMFLGVIGERLLWFIGDYTSTDVKDGEDGPNHESGFGDGRSHHYEDNE